MEEENEIAIGKNLEKVYYRICNNIYDENDVERCCLIVIWKE